MGMSEPPYSSRIQEAKQNTFLWGCLSLAAAIILTVVAAMRHDIRSLLVLAWPLLTFAVWEFARIFLVDKERVIGVVIAGALSSAIGLLFLNSWLSPVIPASPLPIETDCSSISQSAPAWLRIAAKECGQKELQWPQENQRINEYFAALKDGKHHRQDLEDPSSDWASPFVEWTLNQVGVSGPKSIDPLAWLNWGKKIETPTIGAIVVLSFGNGGDALHHVGFFFRDDGDRIQVLGGNEDDLVKISDYAKSAVLGYRWPSDPPSSTQARKADESAETFYASRFFLSGFLLRSTAVCQKNVQHTVNIALSLIATPDLKALSGAYPKSTQGWTAEGANVFDMGVMHDGLRAACVYAIRTTNEAEVIVKGDNNPQESPVDFLLTAEIPDLTIGPDVKEKVKLDRGLFRRNLELIVLETRPDSYVVGDFDNSGHQDIAAIIEANGGGSGTFIYLVVFAINNGAPQFVAANMLGDRVLVKKLRFADGILQVDIVAQGGEDALCCPTHPKTVSFQLKHNSLAQAHG